MRDRAPTSRTMLVAATAICAAVPFTILAVEHVVPASGLSPWQEFLWIWPPVGLIWLWLGLDLPGSMWVELGAFFLVCAIALTVTGRGGDLETVIPLVGLIVLPVVGVLRRNWRLALTGAILGLGLAGVRLWRYPPGVGTGGHDPLVGLILAYVILFCIVATMDAIVAVELARREEALLAARRRAEESEQRYRLIAESAADLVALHDADGLITYASPSWETHLRHHPDDLAGRNLFDLCHRDDIARLAACFAAAHAGRSGRVACRLRSRAGEYTWFEIQVRRVADADSGPTRLRSAARDISERKSFEEQLIHQAFHDALTSLPNRSLFLERLRHALLRTPHGGAGQPAVLFLDLDNFKQINESLGHAAGDRLLVALSGRILGLLTAGDTLARLGGDEFAVLLEGTDGSGAAEVLAGGIEEALREPFALEGDDLYVTVSIGIVDHDGGEATPDDVLRKAEAAMYAAKGGGKAQHRLFDRTMSAEAGARLQLDSDLRRAIERGELLLYFQPIVTIANGDLVGFEALLRWRHPRRGLLGPVSFVPRAEETGLIVPIGRWVLAEACRQAKLWQKLFPMQPPLLMSINVSPRQLQAPDFSDQVNEILAETRVNPRGLQFEITESAFLENGEETGRVLEWLRGLGITLAIDDFGIGYSSMAYLKNFPVDAIKIDRTFVARLGRDPEDTAIVRSLISLGRDLKIRVSGEGVETAEQLEHLRAQACEYGQGYLFARPMPGEQAEAYLAEASASRSKPGGAA